jgi:hypothetical protein
MKIILTFLTLTFLISCQNESTNSIVEPITSLVKKKIKFKIPASFLVKPKTYTVNPARDTSLSIGNGKSTLHIPKNCFVDKNGSIIKT